MMTQADYLNSLSLDLTVMEKSLYWLRRSYRICSKFGIKPCYTEDEFDAIDPLKSRYARTSDIIHKVFRTIDRVEFEEGGTMIDLINRAHKRGLFNSDYEIRAVKDLRNKIAHEYEKEDVESVYVQVLRFTPELIAVADRVRAYCSRYIGSLAQEGIA